MKISREQLLGNWAEQHVASLLADAGCLIRHVPQGHDSGIDLYCESTLGGTPFHHFWCQVKGTAKVTGKEPSISFPFTKKHLEYWRRQPIPVFMIVVPRVEKITQPPLFLFSALPQEDNGGKPRRSILKVRRLADLSDFLSKRLPSEVARWELSQGKVSHIRSSIKPGYTISFLPRSTPRYEQNISQSIIYALWRLSEDLIDQQFDFNSGCMKTTAKLKKNQLADAVAPYIRALEAIVTPNKIPQANYQVTFGLLRELQGDFKEAERFYREAVKRVDDDPNLKPLDKDWRKRRTKWARYLRRAIRHARVKGRGDR